MGSPSPNGEPATSAPPGLMLTRAFCWRLLSEGKRYLVVPLLPFVVVLISLALLATLGGEGVINGADRDTTVAGRYAHGPHALTMGLLLTLGPALVALFGAVSVTRTVQGLIGAEVSRGGYEELLGAPYAPGRIAGAMLGYTVAVGTAYWAVLTAIETAALAVVSGVLSVRLDLSGAYLACTLLLPLLVVWAGGSLALLVSLIFPRLTQLGAGVSLSGGSIGNLVSLLPGLGAVFAMAYGLSGLGPGPLLLLAGGATALITAISMTAVRVGFRPETVLDS